MDNQFFIKDVLEEFNPPKYIVEKADPTIIVTNKETKCEISIIPYLGMITVANEKGSNASLTTCNKLHSLLDQRRNVNEHQGTHLRNYQDC